MSIWKYGQLDRYNYYDDNTNGNYTDMYVEMQCSCVHASKQKHVSHFTDIQELKTRPAMHAATDAA